MSSSSHGWTSAGKSYIPPSVTVPIINENNKDDIRYIQSEKRINRRRGIECSKFLLAKDSEASCTTYTNTAETNIEKIKKKHDDVLPKPVEISVFPQRFRKRKHKSLPYSLIGLCSLQASNDSLQKSFYDQHKRKHDIALHTFKRPTLSDLLITTKSSSGLIKEDPIPNKKRKKDYGFQCSDDLDMNMKDDNNNPIHSDSDTEKKSPSSASVTRLTALSNACHKDSSNIEAWLEYSAYESHAHKLLSLTDRLNRRLDILKLALEANVWNITLLDTIMQLVVERYAQTETLSLWKDLFDTLHNPGIGMASKQLQLILPMSHLSQTQTNETLINNNLTLSSKKQPCLSLLHSFFNFFCTSFDIFNVSAYKDLFSNYSHFYSDHEHNTYCNEAFIEWRRMELSFFLHLASAGHFDLLGPLLSALGHIDFLISKHDKTISLKESVSEMNTMKRLPYPIETTQYYINEVKDFFASGAPRLGNTYAASMYSTLASSSTPEVIHTITDISETLLSQDGSNSFIVNIQKDKFQEQNYKHILQFYDEDSEDSHSLISSLNSNMKWNGYKNRFDVSFNCIETSLKGYINSQHYYKPLRHVVLELLNFPFALCHYSSNAWNYQMMASENISGLCFLKAAAHGLYRRLFRNIGQTESHFLTPIQNITSCNLKKPVPKSIHEKEVSKNTTTKLQIDLSDIFGYHLDLNYNNELDSLFYFGSCLKHFTRDVLEYTFVEDNQEENSSSLKNTLNHLCHFLNELNSFFWNKQLKLLQIGCSISTQMLLWAPKDLTILFNVMSCITYMGHYELGRALLQLYEQNAMLWLAFAFFQYCSNATVKKLHSSRKLLYRFIMTASNHVDQTSTTTSIFHSGFSFLLGWIRMEYLALYSLIYIKKETCLVNTRESSSKNNTPFLSTVYVPPVIIHLILCFLEESLDPWNTFHETILRPLELLLLDQNLHMTNISSCQAAIIDQDVKIPFWDKHFNPTHLRLNKALNTLHRLIQQHNLSKQCNDLNNIKDNGILSIVHCPLCPSEFFSMSTCDMLLTTLCHGPKQGWNTFKLLLQNLEIEQKKKNKQMFQHDIELAYDILLLTILVSSPTFSNSIWPIEIVKEVIQCGTTLFPSHQRTYLLASQLSQRTSLLTMRSILPNPTPYNIDGLIIAELQSGYPSYIRCISLFEAILTTSSIDEKYKKKNTKHSYPSTTSSSFHLFLVFLHLVNHLGSFFFSEFPNDPYTILNKISTVAERGRFAYPYSKRLWLHRLTAIKMMMLLSTNNDTEAERLLETRFHAEIDLYHKREIRINLDPLEL